MTDPASPAAIDVEILYIRGCPNFRPLTALVRELVLEMGLSATLREHEIGNGSELDRAEFRGSPTLLIDGRDIEGHETSQCDSVSLSCRTYSGKRLPARDSVRAALRASVSPGT